MKIADIPKDAMDQICRQAEEAWGDDPETKAETLENEVRYYLAFHTYEYGKAEVVRAKLIADTCDGIFGLWEEKFNWLDSEAKAYNALQDLNIDGVPAAYLQEAAKAAAASQPDSY